MLVLLAVVAVACEGAVTPSGTADNSGEPATGAPTQQPRATSIQPPPERVPHWRADEVPSTDGWASIVVVIDLVDGVDASRARDMRLAVIELMVNATDGTEIGVVRASDGAETIVEPVAMGSGREAAIERVWSAPLNGSRNLAAGLARATAPNEGSHGSSLRRGILLLTTATDESVAPLLHDDPLRDVHAIAYGASAADETIVARLALFGGGLFGSAVEPAELSHRVADVRRELEQMTLVASGTLEVDAAGRASAPVAIGSGQVHARFAARGVAADALTVTNAAGEEFTTTEAADDVRVTAFDEWAALSVGAPSAGEWQFEVRGAPAGREVPYEVETFFSDYPAARAQADLDATEGLTIGYMDGGLPRPATVTATLRAADGSEQVTDLEDAPEGDSLVCCLQNMRQAHLDGPIQGGSHVITVRSAGGDGEQRYERLVRFGFYMWPAIDSDGDGIRDQVELSHGMNPDDRADADLDADTDGLSMARELGELSTDPFDYDSDDGGEGDGSEVAAGRDPARPGDDVVAAACYDESSIPESDEFVWRDDAPRAPDLEALLPDVLLGERMEKVSIAGLPQFHGSFTGYLWYALVQCAGGSPERLEVAYATGSDWAGRVALAIRVGRDQDGAVVPIPATELVDAFLHRIRPGMDLAPRPFELDGRSAIMTDGGLLLYAHDDVLYMTMGLYIGDCWEDCGSPPNLEELAADLLPKLPAPGD